MSQNNLSQVLFHGSMAKLKPGDIIKPQELPGYGAPLAFATPHHSVARDFSVDKDGNKGHIYHVEPLDASEVSKPSTIKGGRDWETEVISKKGFKVVKRVPRRMSSDQLNALTSPTK